MSDLTVNIPTAQIGKCEDYVDEDGPQIKTAIITPLRVTLVTRDSYKISFGCNFWRSCQNVNCSYCQMGMGMGRRDEDIIPPDTFPRETKYGGEE